MRSLLIAFAASAAFTIPAAAEDTPTSIVAVAPQAVVLQPQRTNWENKSDKIDIRPASSEPEQNNFAATGKDPENAKR